MSSLVNPEDIERLVGAERHPTAHRGRAVTADGVVYVLHSRACLDSGIDLRECSYSVALDRGVDTGVWIEVDAPVTLAISAGRLVTSGRVR